MNKKLLAVAVAGTLSLAVNVPSQAADPLGKGMVMYVQMGGNAGDGATWARTNGALAAGEAFGIKSRFFEKQLQGPEPSRAVALSLPPPRGWLLARSSASRSRQSTGRSGCLPAGSR